MRKKNDIPTNTGIKEYCVIIRELFIRDGERAIKNEHANPSFLLQSSFIEKNEIGINSV
jgi:hypothetical protein